MKWPWPAPTASFLPVSLGQRILRAETAAIAAITVAMYSSGELGLVDSPHSYPCGGPVVLEQHQDCGGTGKQKVYVFRSVQQC